jgi:thioredoxin-like negative regulator of GroEL
MTAKHLLSFQRIANENTFERLCRDIWSEVWRDTNAKLHGRKGQKQYGVDVWGIDKSKISTNKKYSAIQSKKRNGNFFGPSDLTEDELRHEIEEAMKFDDGELEELVIATTLDDSVEYDKLVRKLSKEYDFNVRFAGWQTIEDYLSEYDNVREKYYPSPSGSAETKLLQSIVSTSNNKQLNIAKENIEAGNPLAALTILKGIEDQGVSTLSKDERFKLYTYIAVAYSLGKKDEASSDEYFEKAEAEKVEDPLYYRNSAAVAYTKGDLEKARSLIDQGMKKFKKNSLKALDIAIAYAEEGTSEPLLKKYRSQADDSEEIAYQLALMTSQDGKRDIAIEILEKHSDTGSSKYSFEHTQTVALLASLYVESVTAKTNYLLGHFTEKELSEIDRAEELLDYVLEMVSDKQIRNQFADLYSRRSVIHQIKGMDIEAVADAKAAFEVDPHNDQNAGNYAMLLARQNRSADAHDALKPSLSEFRSMVLDAIIYGKEGNFDEEAKVLNGLLDGNSAKNNEDRIVAHNALISSLFMSDKLAEVEEAIERYENEFDISADTLEYRAALANKRGDPDAEIDLLKKAALAIKPDTLRETVASIGARLENLKLYDEAVGVLQQIVTTNTYDSLLQKYIISLWKTRRFNEAENLCKEVINKFGPKQLCVDILFNIAIQKTDMQAAVEFLEALPQSAKTTEYELKLAQLYSDKGEHTTALSKINALNKSDFTNDDTMRYAQIQIQSGDKMLAIDQLYDAIQKDRTDPNLQMAYITTIMLNNDLAFSVPSTIEPDTTVILQSKEGDYKRTYTIEKSKSNGNTSNHHYSMDHPVAKSLLGAKKGDLIEIGQNKYTIVSFENKYLPLHRELGETFSENFPDIQFMTKVRVIDEDGNVDLSEIQKSLGDTRKQSEDLLEMATKGRLPIPVISNVTGKSYIDVLYAALMSADGKLNISPNQQTPNDLSDTIILDLSACIVLSTAGLKLPKLSKQPIVLNSTLKLLDDKLKELNKDRKAGGKLRMMYSDNGKIRMSETTKEGITSDIETLEKVSDWIKLNASVKPLSNPGAIDNELYEQSIETVGAEWTDILTELLADAPDALLVSDDFALRALFSTEHKEITTINSQQLVELFFKLEHCQFEDFSKIMEYLIDKDLSLVYLTSEILLKVLQEENLKVTARSRKFIQAIGDERAQFGPCLGVAVQFLYEYWKLPGSQLYWDQISSAVLSALISRKDYASNAYLVDPVIDKVFYIVPKAAEELIQTKNLLLKVS